MVSRSSDVIEGRTVSFSILEIAAVIWAAKFRIGLVTLFCMAGAFGLSQLLTKTYVAKGEVVVRAEAANAPDVDRAFNATAVNDAVVSTERSVLSADGLLSRVSKQVVFPPTAIPKSIFYKVLDQAKLWLGINSVVAVDADQTRDDVESRQLAYLKTAVETSVEKGSSVIAVTAGTPDAAFSAEVVNNLLRDYMEDRVSTQRSVARNVEVALQERLKQTNDQIRSTQARIAELMEEPGLIESTEIPVAERNLTLLNDQLSQAKLLLLQKQQSYDFATQLRNSANGNPARMAELLDYGSQTTSELRARFVNKEQQVANLSSQFGPNFPSRVAAQKELDVISGRLGSEVDRIIAQKKADLDSAHQAVSDLTNRYDTERSTSSKDSTETLKLSREKDSLENLRRISGVIEDRLITVTSQPVDPNARILTTATKPTLASFPNKPLLLALGLIIGLVLSCGYTLVVAFVKRSRITAAAFASIFDGPLLGAIPEMYRSSADLGLLESVRRSRNRKGDRSDLAFQGIALELDYALTRSKARVLTVTSALPKAGKSTVALGISLKLSKIGKRVLLINCDLHPNRTRYTEREHIKNSDGSFAPIIMIEPESKLSVLELAPTNTPLEFLMSQAFRDIIDISRTQYDVVVCDTPPALSVPDPLIVARYSDGVVAITEFGRNIDVEKSTEFARRLETTGKPISGLILTKLRDDEDGCSSYLGYGQRLATRRLIS